MSRMALRAPLFLFVSLILSFAVRGFACDADGPAKNGRINRGGYVFEWESVKGSGCITYRLRNVAGQPVTPVKWNVGNDAVIDGALPACIKEPCKWQIGTQPAYLFNELETQISFGLNAEQFKANPVAFVGKVSSAAVFPASTELIGSFADSTGAPVSLYVAIKSRQSWRKAALYDVSLTQYSEGGRPEPEGDLMFVWKTADGVVMSEPFRTKNGTKTFRVPKDAFPDGRRPIIEVLRDGKKVASFPGPPLSNSIGTAAR
jgi:hypothetical protein